MEKAGDRITFSQILMAEEISQQLWYETQIGYSYLLNLMLLISFYTTISFLNKISRVYMKQ